WLAMPQLFAWILALVFLSVAERERRRRSRGIWMLPVIAALWANMHGSFLLGPAILFIYALGEWIIDCLPSPFGRGRLGSRRLTCRVRVARLVSLRRPSPAASR